MLVGNTNSGDPIRGDLTASYGSILIGKADFEFSTLMPSTSGFAVEGFCQEIIELSIAQKAHYLITRNNDHPVVFSQK